MVAWLNRAVFQVSRNGTNTSTVDPSSSTDLVSGSAFTPTAGNLLVVVVEGSVTSTTPSGWTLPSGGSALNNTGLYVWYRTAASGSNAFSTVHNGSNYPIGVAVYEFPAGSTFVPGGSAITQSVGGATTPTVTGLTGSTNVGFGVMATGLPSVASTFSSAWNTPVTKDVELVQIGSPTDGYGLSIGYQEGVSTSTWNGTYTGSATNFAGNAEVLSFAVNVAAGGGSNAGSVSAPVPLLRASATGQSSNPGSMLDTLKTLVASLSGQSVNSGVIAAALPRATAQVSAGSVNSGALSASAPVIKASVSGAQLNSGVASAAVPKITSSIVDTTVNTGTLNSSVPVIKSSLAGSSFIAAGLSGSVPKLQATLVDQLVQTVTLVASVARVVSQVSGASSNPGTLTALLPAPRAGLLGQAANSGSVSCTSPRITFYVTDVAEVIFTPPRTRQLTSRLSSRSLSSPVSDRILELS